MQIKDAWFTVEKIDDITFAISEYGHWEQVHSYLLIGAESAALIDTGLGIDHIKRITDQLTKLPIIVITTHVHADHIGSHDAFETIYVHEADADWLKHGIKGLPLEQIRKDMARNITIPVPDTFNPNIYKPYQGEPTGLLGDGDIVELGERSLIIYHTPGHSPGHICIFDTKKRYLFTGDLLYTGTPIYAFYPSTNPIDLVNSLEKIAGMKAVAKIYGGHNDLEMDASLLDEVQEAVIELRKQDVVRHGTGIHTFHRFSVQF